MTGPISSAMSSSIPCSSTTSRSRFSPTWIQRWPRGLGNACSTQWSAKRQPSAWITSLAWDFSRSSRAVHENGCQSDDLERPRELPVTRHGVVTLGGEHLDPDVVGARLQMRAQARSDVIDSSVQYQCVDEAVAAAAMDVIIGVA